MWDVVQKQRQDNSDQADQGRLPGGGGSCLPFKTQHSATFYRKTSVPAHLGQAPLQGFHQPLGLLPSHSNLPWGINFCRSIAAAKMYGGQRWCHLTSESPESHVNDTS